MVTCPLCAIYTHAHTYRLIGMITIIGGSITTSGGGCIPLRELDAYMKPTGSLGFDWVDLTSSYTYSTLTVLGNTG